MPGRFKDYISTPKQNDYRSIHTTIVGPGRQRVELQIRTRGMHEIAEYGVAAHALYKDSESDADAKCCRARFKRLCAGCGARSSMLAEGDNPEEFLEHTKLELFQDQVFCFTPKGRLIALPRGATPIDFAYAVHTDVGNTGVGAKINGRTDAAGHRSCRTATRSRSSARDGADRRRRRGSRSWSPARRAPRSAARRARRCARNMPGSAARSSSAPSRAPSKPFSDDRLSGALARLARASAEDVLAAVGRGEIRADDVVKAVYPDWRGERAGAQAGAARRRLVRAAARGELAVPHSRVPRQPERGEARGCDPDPRHERAICRCASRRTAARCPATASSAS